LKRKEMKRKIFSGKEMFELSFKAMVEYFHTNGQGRSLLVKGTTEVTRHGSVGHGSVEHD
jgi:hypothetical protein